MKTTKEKLGDGAIYLFRVALLTYFIVGAGVFIWLGFKFINEAIR